MHEFKPVIYRSFAEFFDREIRPSARTFVAASNEMAAFPEARYFGWRAALRKSARAADAPAKGRAKDRRPAKP
jgi:hypothetical protein